jgi:hypothetical protein
MSRDFQMHVDSYQFGKVIIDGRNYTSDCIILGNTVQADWWRKQGHLLSVEDIETIIAAKPAVLVVGCGASEMMKVSEQTRQTLQKHNIRLEALDTHGAIQKFNELLVAGVNVAAALHLTC